MVGAAFTGARPPELPEGLAAVASSRTSVTMAWKLPAEHGGSPVVGYQVELQAKTKAAAVYMGHDWLKIFDGDATACTINSLRPGCVYRIRVRAANSAGWSQWTMPHEITTQADVPEVPLALQLASSGPVGCISV